MNQHFLPFLTGTLKPKAPVIQATDLLKTLGARHRPWLMPPKNMIEYADQELQPEAKAQLDEEEGEDEVDEEVRNEDEEDLREEAESEDDLALLEKDPKVLQEQMEFEVRQWCTL